MYHMRSDSVFQAIRSVKRRKVNIDFNSCRQSQFDSRNHITISRDNNGNVTIVIVSVIDNLSCYSDIGFFLFVS